MLNLKLLRRTRTASHVATVYDKAQTPCAQVLEWTDVTEQRKGGLRITCADVNEGVLLPEALFCRDQFDEIANKGQLLVIKKRGRHLDISDDAMTPASDSTSLELTWSGRPSCVEEETSCGSTYA